MRHLLLPLAAIAMLAASCEKSADNGYTVTVSAEGIADGTPAYITSLDSGDKIDSAAVTSGQIVFNGNADTPEMARVLINGKRAGMIVLEPGTITLAAGTRWGIGTPLNDKMAAFAAQTDSLAGVYSQMIASDSISGREAVEAQLDSVSAATLAENVNNPIGFYILLQDAYNWDLPTFDAKLKEYPQWAQSKKLNSLRNGLKVKEETSVGHPYKDFEVEYDGKVQKLSDYVGKGKFTLVDFFASWCGPCMREIPVLKKILEKYGDKGLEVVGVAVWDEPQNTAACIESQQIPWQVIMNTQNVATDAYGIPAIPCIILIDPQGNIVSRDKTGDDLVNDVDRAMNASVTDVE